AEVAARLAVRALSVMPGPFMERHRPGSPEAIFPVPWRPPPTWRINQLIRLLRKIRIRRRRRRRRSRIGSQIGSRIRVPDCRLGFCGCRMWACDCALPVYGCRQAPNDFCLGLESTPAGANLGTKRHSREVRRLLDRHPRAAVGAVHSAHHLPARAPRPPSSHLGIVEGLHGGKGALRDDDRALLVALTGLVVQAGGDVLDRAIEELQGLEHHGLSGGSANDHAASVWDREARALSVSQACAACCGTTELPRSRRRCARSGTP